MHGKGGRAVSIVSDAAIRAETEIASGPDVWFVLLQYEACKTPGNGWWAQPLIAVQLPNDLDRFRLWDDGNGFDVMVKFRGRWYSVIGAWRQLKRMNLDAAENRACNVVTFGRRILKKMGVKPWKARK